MFANYNSCNFPFVSQQPERISGEQYGIHADVWSVGISFMEVVLLHCIVPKDSHLSLSLTGESIECWIDNLLFPDYLLMSLPHLPAHLSPH